MEKAIINVADAVNQGKDITEIETEYCTYEVSILKERASQRLLMSLVSKLRTKISNQLITILLLMPWICTMKQF